MNLDLEERLTECGVTFTRLSKSDKVRVLARWTKEVPELVASARHGRALHGVARDKDADIEYAKLRDQEFFVLPDDQITRS